jgi:hypothetical protein
MKFEIGKWSSRGTYELLVKLKDTILHFFNCIFYKAYNELERRSRSDFKIVYELPEYRPVPRRCHTVAIIFIPLIWAYGSGLIRVFLYKYTGFLQEVNKDSTCYIKGLTVV